MVEVYVLDWPNGNTDVFEDEEDAAECYKLPDNPQDWQVEFLEHAKTGGTWVRMTFGCIGDTISKYATWSDKARNLYDSELL